jgi:hypothetical protein
MRSLSPAETRALILSVGTHKGKRPLSPVEVARLIKRELDSGASPSEVAGAVQFDGTTMIGRFLRLLDLSSDIQHLVDFGSGDDSLGFTAAFEMARVPRLDHEEFSTAILEHQLSSAEVRQVAQLRLRSKRAIADCIHTVIGMRPHVEIRHVYIGAVLDDAIRKRLSSMTQLQRNELLRDLLAERFASLRIGTGRLGAERFTLVGGDELSQAMRGSLEQEVNAELVKRVH